MRARATVLQFWLSSLPNMILVDLHKHCTLRRFLWFSKVKNVNTSSFSTHKESTSSLFYRLACRLLILSNLQIRCLKIISVFSWVFGKNICVIHSHVICCHWINDLKKILNDNITLSGEMYPIFSRFRPKILADAKGLSESIGAKI